MTAANDQRTKALIASLLVPSSAELGFALDMDSLISACALTVDLIDDTIADNESDEMQDGWWINSDEDGRTWKRERESEREKKRENEGKRELGTDNCRHEAPEV